MVFTRTCLHPVLPLLSLLQRLFSPRRNDIQASLRERGAARELVRFAGDYEDPVTLWHSLPRGTWALTLAARVGVQRGLQSVALLDLVEEAGRTRREPEPDESDDFAFDDLVGFESAGFGPPSDSPAWRRGGATPDLLAETRRLADEWGRDAIPVDAFCTEVVRLVALLIDAQPQIRKLAVAQGDAQRWGRLGDVVRYSAEHDIAYAEAHGAMAQRVRTRIAAEHVRAAIMGHPASPYR